MKLTYLALCLTLAPMMRADTIVLTLDGTFSPPDYVFYSYTDTSGAAQDNIPVDPYITYVNGSTYNNAVAYTFCYDFNSPTDIGTAYSGTFQVRTDTASLEATYLINQLNYFGLINAPLSVRGPISTAIWEIMNPSSDTSLSQFPSDPAAQPYELEAAEAVMAGSWTAQQAAYYPFWVPDNPSIQRFGVVFEGQQPIPEPASLILIACGLLLVFVMRYRRAHAVAVRRQR